MNKNNFLVDLQQIQSSYASFWSTLELLFFFFNFKLLAFKRESYIHEVIDLKTLKSYSSSSPENTWCYLALLLFTVASLLENTLNSSSGPNWTTVQFPPLAEPALHLLCVFVLHKPPYSHYYVVKSAALRRKYRPLLSGSERLSVRSKTNLGYILPG